MRRKGADGSAMGGVGGRGSGAREAGKVGVAVMLGIVMGILWSLYNPRHSSVSPHPQISPFNVWCCSCIHTCSRYVCMFMGFAMLRPCVF